MSVEEAIRLIQIHERARQGRLRAKFMREIRQQEEREKQAALRGAPTLDPEVAAVRIQKVFLFKLASCLLQNVSLILTTNGVISCFSAVERIFSEKKSEKGTRR